MALNYFLHGFLFLLNPFIFFFMLLFGLIVNKYELFLNPFYILFSVLSLNQ
jgi:hypothetical protein